MICKWCGETVKSGDKTCRRCRREVSPLSDCGGFYDLVPQSRNAAAPAPVDMQMPAPQPRPAPVKPVLPEKKNNIPNIVAIVAAVLAIAMLVCTLSLNGKLKAAEAQIESLKRELSDAEEQVPASDATNPSKPGGDGPDIGGEDDPENPVEDVALSKELLDGKLEMTLTEDANKALAAGKQVKITCTDENGEAVCVLTLTGLKIEDEVHVIVEVDAQWEDVYFEWYDPENEDRPMRWEMGGDMGMFNPENERGESDASDEDEKSDDEADKDQKEESYDAPCNCEVTVKLAEEPFSLSCAITAKDGKRDVRIVIDNIQIG